MMITAEQIKQLYDEELEMVVIKMLNGEIIVDVEARLLLEERWRKIKR